MSGLRAFLLGALLLLDSVTATAAAGLDELLRLFAQRREGHVQFTEVHELAMLKRPLVSSGELLYQAPDRLEKRTLTPKPETLVLEGSVLRAQRGKRQRVLDLREHPEVAPLIESIRATLAGDRSALEHYFTCEFSGDLEHWRLRLQPRDANVARSVQQVTLSGERAAIHSVEIRQPDGDRSVLSLGPELPP